MKLEIKIEDKTVFERDTDNSYNNTIMALIDAIDLLDKQRQTLLKSLRKDYPNDEIPISLSKILIN